MLCVSCKNEDEVTTTSKHFVMVDKLAVAGNDASVWNDKSNTQITMLLRDVENDKIQSFLFIASYSG